MRLTKSIKAVLMSASVFAVVIWLTAANSPQSVVKATGDNKPAANDYVGSDTCQACHEDTFKAYSHTMHASLGNLPAWKNKTTGCESCHGPGKAHVDGGGDKTKIITFTGKSSKEISETCLSCHAGRDERNNFRRGEHWRNDIGCVDCHSPHSTIAGRNVASSNMLVTTANAEKPGVATVAMLKANDPQLCTSCHSEVKPQFTAPFHHKVLEGAMRCSDCHNPHGGFETKQTRLATGADAACMKCHADKQGPFAYEHAPVKTEGCSACHTPHGSGNPRMLRSSNVGALCLECHSNSHGSANLDTGVGSVIGGPAKNLALQYKDCTVCHLKVHGSNTSPVFFR